MRHPYDDMRSTSPLAMMIDPDASAISHESPYRSIDPMRPERREPVASKPNAFLMTASGMPRSPGSLACEPAAPYQHWCGKLSQALLDESHPSAETTRYWTLADWRKYYGVID